MTEEQKDNLIAKMLDAPSSLSDEELDAIVHDDELRDIYGMSSAMSGACIHQPEIDMDDEWNCFRPRLRRKPSPMRWVMRVAAIFLGVLVASGITVRLLDRLLISDERPVMSMLEQQDMTDTIIMPYVEVPDTVAVAEPPTAPSVERKEHVAEHEPLIAKAEVATAEDIEQAADVDVDEFLRIQQARIDNDLAMQAVEVFEDEYIAMCQIYDIIGEDDKVLDDTFRKITMQ